MPEGGQVVPHPVKTGIVGFPLAHRKGQRPVDNPVFHEDAGYLRDIFLGQRPLQGNG